MAAKDRPFTRAAASIAFGAGALQHLDSGCCPSCGKHVNTDEMNVADVAEFKISGLCSSCQRETFSDDV